MELNHKAEVFYLNDKPVTHLVIAAHQDDVEIMCGDGIASCYSEENKGLLAVIVSDGGGSPRNGEFADFTTEQMIDVRKKEQLNAAKKGNFAVLIMLSHPSVEINLRGAEIINELQQIITKFAPQVIYTHNPADKHQTHVSVFMSVLAALKRSKYKPHKFYGCECWRGLDWLTGEDKVIFNLSGYDALLSTLLNEHFSQVRGGKRYDLASEGRRKSNATFLKSHNVDKLESASYAMDLMPLLTEEISVQDFISAKIERLKASIFNLLSEE